MNNKKNKKRKVVVIALYDRASLGVRSLFSTLKRNNIDTSVIFFKELSTDSIKPPSEKETAALLKLLKELNPSIIGISLRSSYFKLAAALTEKIKKETDALIVWGGVHSTICPEDCINYTDVLCRGEGDFPMLELAKAVESGTSFDRIENLWIKKDGKIIKNAMKPIEQSLDGVSVPVYDKDNEYLIEGNRVRRGIVIDGLTTYVIMTTRGCPFNCTYCGNTPLKKLYSGQKFVRWRSVENIFEELEAAVKSFKSIKKIFFVDELFVSDIKWMKKFMDRYKKTINLPFEVVLHPNYVKEEMIVLLKEVGLKDVVIGIQSGSERILHEVYKRFTSRKQILDMHKMLQKNGIGVTYDIILDNPLETDDDKRQTLNLLLELNRPFRLHLYSLTHFPKTELTESLLSKNMIRREDVEDHSSKTFTNWRIHLTSRRPKDDLFWNGLVLLTSHKLMPKSFIRSMSRSSFLKKHPLPIVIIANIFRAIRVVELGLGMLFRGELNIPTIKKSIKQVRSIT